MRERWNWATNSESSTDMASQALVFLLETFFGLFILALLLRFYLQLFRAPPYNQLSQFLAAVTNFAVLRARRVIPGLWGADLATLVLAWLTEILLRLLVLFIAGHTPGGSAIGAGLIALGVFAAVKLLKLSIYILMVAVIVQAVLSWVNPYSPAAPILDSLTRPFLRPFRRWIPPIANVDLSPLFVLIACQLVLMLPVAWLEMSLARIL
jgi:YggT family protein